MRDPNFFEPPVTNEVQTASTTGRLTEYRDNQLFTGCSYVAVRISTDTGSARIQVKFGAKGTGNEAITRSFDVTPQHTATLLLNGSHLGIDIVSLDSGTKVTATLLRYTTGALSPLVLWQSLDAGAASPVPAGATYAVWEAAGTATFTQGPFTIVQTLSGNSDILTPVLGSSVTPNVAQTVKWYITQP